MKASARNSVFCSDHLFAAIVETSIIYQCIQYTQQNKQYEIENRWVTSNICTTPEIVQRG